MNKLTNKDLLTIISNRFEKNYKYWVIKWIDKTLPKKLWFNTESIEVLGRVEDCTIITLYWFKTCNSGSVSNFIKENDVVCFIYKTLLNNPRPKELEVSLIF